MIQMKTLTKLLLPKLHQGFVTALRRVSAYETTAVLRPFYFLVHPDLFGKHPREKRINEDSLKQLREHLEKLQLKRNVTLPLRLVFFVRNAETQQSESKSNFRAIRITLRSSCVRESVQTVLKLSGISHEYINSISNREVSSASPGPANIPHQVDWHHVWYSFYGIANPNQVPYRPINTLSSWLQKNLERARKNQKSVEPVREEITRLQNQLKEEVGIYEVRWASNWALPQFRACLVGLYKLYTQHADELQQLKGHTVVFGNETGVCLQGDIILRSNDVPSAWYETLMSISKHDRSFAQLSSLEYQLSRHLQNIKIVRRTLTPIIIVNDYVNELYKLIGSLNNYRTENPYDMLEGDYSDVKLSVECVRGPINLSAAGEIQVPSSCAAFLLLDFIRDNAKEARHRADYYDSVRQRESDLTHDCRLELGLTSLTKDTNITPEQMEYCCRRLMGDTRQLGQSVDKCPIQVTNFYSVMSDGQICIPWNWQGVLDSEDI